MLNIVQVETDAQISQVRTLLWEYMNWSNLMVSREFGVSLDVNAIVEQDMAKFQQYMPPAGRLLLAEYEESIAGCAGLRKIGEDIGEIKRMYVKPEFRRKGIGKVLLQTIINEARVIGYSKIRLDSALYAASAQALYHSFGFQDIQPYAGSEIPEKYHQNWIFMECIVVS
jgi:N-acetylglutamate synthase-like GNAT family acetyltransferase